jgi:hypothetical protein
MSSYVIVIHSRSLRRYERARPAVEFLHSSDLLGPMATDCFQFARMFNHETTARAVLHSYVASDPEARGEVWKIDKLIEA